MNELINERMNDLPTHSQAAWVTKKTTASSYYYKCPSLIHSIHPTLYPHPYATNSHNKQYSENKSIPLPTHTHYYHHHPLTPRLQQPHWKATSPTRHPRTTHKRLDDDNSGNSRPPPDYGYALWSDRRNYPMFPARCTWPLLMTHNPRQSR